MPVDIILVLNAEHVQEKRGCTASIRKDHKQMPVTKFSDTNSPSLTFCFTIHQDIRVLIV